MSVDLNENKLFLKYADNQAIEVSITGIRTVGALEHFLLTSSNSLPAFYSLQGPLTFHVFWDSSPLRPDLLLSEIMSQRDFSLDKPLIVKSHSRKRMYVQFLSVLFLT